MPERRTALLTGWRPLLAAGVVYALLVAGIVMVRVWPAAQGGDYAALKEETTSDFRDFWYTARHFRDTGALTDAYGVHNYLPFFTLFMLPWSFLPLPAAAALFALLSVGLFAAAVALVEQLLNNGVRRGPRPATYLALALLAPYVHSCAVLGNVMLLVLFLVLAAWYLVEHGHDAAAGVALGLATLVKLLPAVLIVFLLLKRRWTAAGVALAVVGVAGFGLPAASVGPAEAWREHRAFCERAVGGHSALTTLTAEKPPKAMYSNTALPMVLRRLFSPLSGGKTDTRPVYVTVAELPPTIRVGLWGALTAALLATSTLAAVRYSRPWPPRTERGVWSVRSQFGAWCVLALLTSPLVWTHYYVLAYWPLALAADAAARRAAPSRGARLAVAAWVVGIAALAWPAARAAGAPLWATGAVWLWCVARGGGGKDPGEERLITAPLSTSQ